MSKERDNEIISGANALSILFCLAAFAMACVASYVNTTKTKEVTALRTTITHLEAETANRAATSELQGRVIAAYAAELMRLGYTEQQLDEVQRGK